MSEISMREMLEAGVHFGHQTRYWNPKMAAYLFGHRNKIHIIDLEKTKVLLQEALNFVSKLSANKGTILFVGTKRAAQQIIKEEAQRCDMPYINLRWLGGLLTNYKTVKQSINRLRYLEEMKTDGSMERMSKKEILHFERELEKLERNLSGIKDMNGWPDALFVIDVGYEDIAVSEAMKLKIPVVGIVDSNNSPVGVDYVIPGNDDAIRSIRLYTKAVADAIITGKDSVAHLGESGDKDEFVELDAEGAPIVEARPEKVQVKKKTVKKKTRKTTAPEPAKEEQVAEPSTGEQVAEPAKEEQAPEPAKEEQAPEPAKEEQVAEPAKEEQVAEPAKEEQVAEPAKEEQVAEPAKEEQVAEPAKEEQAAEAGAGKEAVARPEAKPEDPGVEASRTGAGQPEVSRDSAIYECVRLVPKGKVAVYSDIEKQVKQAGVGCTAKQVGEVMRDLPADSDVPWHRIVGKDKKYGVVKKRPGPRGDEEQVRLLEEEGVACSPDGKVDLKLYQYGWGETTSVAGTDLKSVPR